MNPEPLLVKVRVFCCSHMIEKIIERNGEKITEVRSDGGKLLFIKTKKGYEMKCPRTKEICVVRYEEMLADCCKCLEEGLHIDENLAEFVKQKK